MTHAATYHDWWWVAVSLCLQQMKRLQKFVKF
ncbi:hypothetical protein C7M37_00852 [Lactiplantibacillus plantarum]|nr:hypothetical protein C7M37_00852 [Lactiplantibacillus plantarum]